MLEHYSEVDDRNNLLQHILYVYQSLCFCYLQTEEKVETPEISLDAHQRQLAARDSIYGIHGEISEYLTTKTLIRQIYPPPVITKPPMVSY